MKIRIADQLYLICLSLGIVITTISLTAFALQMPLVIDVCNRALLFLCIVQLIRSFYLFRANPKYLVLWSIGAVLLFIGYRISGDRTFLETYAYGTGAIFTNYDKLIRRMKVTWIWCLIIVALFSLLKIIPTAGGVRETGEIKMSLGFVHANTLGFIIFVIGLLIFLDSYEKKRKKSFVILLVLTIIDNFIANSRTTTVLLLIMDIVMASKFFKNDVITHFLNIKWIRNLLIVLVFTLVFFSLLFATTYSEEGKLAQLNRLLSYRIQNGSYYMSLYGISLFGKRIPEFVLWKDNFTRLYLDNGYLLMLIKHGVIAASFYIGMILMSAKKAIKNKNLAVVVAIAVIALSLFTEQSALRWEFCPILMYMYARNR